MYLITQSERRDERMKLLGHAASKQFANQADK